MSAPSGSGAELKAPVVKGIRVFTSGETFGVEITADRDLVYSCTKIAPLRKIFVDLPLTEPGRADSDYQVASAMITYIRLEQKLINDTPVTRITVNLTDDADYTILLDPADKKKLTLSLRKAATDAVTTTTTKAAARPEMVQPPPAAQAIRPNQPLQPPAPTAPPLLPMTKSAAAPANQAVIVSRVNFSADAIEIQTDGAVGEFKAFALLGPGRLVIDIPAARSALREIIVPANRFGVLAARIGTFEGKLRLVFDTGRKAFPRFRVERSGTGLLVLASKR